MNTTSPSSRFAKFVNQFAFGVDRKGDNRAEGVRWTGKVGYVDLGPNALLVARIELDEQGYQGRYSAFRVDIIHRVNGKLDSLVFAFSDLLDPKKRSDERRDHEGFYGWASNGGEIWWYIATPTASNIKNVVAAVNEYLGMWQAPKF